MLPFSFFHISICIHLLLVELALVFVVGLSCPPYLMTKKKYIIAIIGKLIFKYMFTMQDILYTRLS